MERKPPAPSVKTKREIYESIDQAWNVWRVHTPCLLKEIMVNKETAILRIPLDIFRRLLVELVERALELNDTELNSIMVKLTLYDSADPHSKNYDPKQVEATIIKATQIKRRKKQMNLPKVKPFPVDSVQCHECGGHGCDTCVQRGWLVPAENPKGRRCEREACNKPLAPDHVAVYCSNECARDDA